MAESSKNKHPKTGNDFIEKALSAGAHVEPAGKKRGVLFTKISTTAGSMYINPGDQPLDKRTRKNYKHWFRLLGLLVFLALCALMIDAYLYAEGVRIAL